MQDSGAYGHIGGEVKFTLGVDQQEGKVFYGRNVQSERKSKTMIFRQKGSEPGFIFLSSLIPGIDITVKSVSTSRDNVRS